MVVGIIVVESTIGTTVVDDITGILLEGTVHEVLTVFPSMHLHL